MCYLILIILKKKLAYLMMYDLCVFLEVVLLITTRYSISRRMTPINHENVRTGFGLLLFWLYATKSPVTCKSYNNFFYERFFIFKIKNARINIFTLNFQKNVILFLLISVLKRNDTIVGWQILDCSLLACIIIFFH